MPYRVKTFILVCVMTVCVVAAASAAGALELRMIKIIRGSGESICATAQAALSPDGKISFNARTSTIVVLDRPDYLPHIMELVSSLDVKEPAVRMKVRVTEVSDEFIRKAAIHSSQLIFPRGSFSIVEGLLGSGTGAFTRSETTLTMTSGERSELRVSREAVYGAKNAGQQGAPATFVRKKSAGDFLEVLPFVNADNTVLVKIFPGGSSVQQDGSISESSALTQVTLHNGDTLAIGGADIDAGRSGTTHLRRRTMLFLTVQIIY